MNDSPAGDAKNLEILLTNDQQSIGSVIYLNLTTN